MFLEKVHNGRNQWYLYLFSILIVFTSTQIGSLPLIAYLAKTAPHALQDGYISSATGTNAGLALTLLSFAAGFFTLLFCVKYIHKKRCTDIITGRRKVDWGRVFFASLIWGGLSLVTMAVTLLCSDPADIVFQFDPLNFALLAAISLLLFPFQTSFEELLFRGYLMQWSAMLLRYRWAAVLLTGILFALLHVSNPEVDEFGIWLTLPQYILMGLTLGYVAVKDNGTELALGLHMANNILIAVTFTSDSSTLQTHALFKDLHPSVSWTDILMTAVTGLLFIWFCNRKYHFVHKVDLCKKICGPEME